MLLKFETLYACKLKHWGWGDGPISKVLDAELWGREFRPQHYYIKQVVGTGELAQRLKALAAPLPEDQDSIPSP